jgi:pSer/pThr/pTyr-binding forkhead associated (FHA) protein
VLRPSGQVIHLPVGQPEILIGRSDPVKGVYPQVDLAPFGGDVSGVSRKHARLLFSSGQIAIEDLHSTNFTFVNRQKLDPGVPYPLRPGDELRMGLLVMEYQADA